MAKIELSSVSNGNTLTAINENFQKIAAEFQNRVLYRNNPVTEVNTMENDLDMNQKRIFNLPAPVNDNEAARLQDVRAAIAGANTAVLTSFEPYGSISSTNVQGAIQEIVDDIGADLYVNVKDFGVMGDGITNDTTAIQAVLNSGATSVFFPAGTYRIGALVVPNTVKNFLGAGRSTSFVATGAFLDYQAVIGFGNNTRFNVGNFNMTVDKTLYPTNIALAFDSCTVGLVSNVTFPSAGFFACYCSVCFNMTFRDIEVTEMAVSGFRAEFSSNNITLDGFRTMGPGLAHSMQMIGGKGHKIVNCHSNGSATNNFGINLNGCTYSLVSNNTVVTQFLEGINVQDSSYCTVANNIVECAAGHLDFGISVYGASIATTHNVVTGNQVYFSGKAGIALASNGAISCKQNHVVGNLVVSPNQLNEANGAGILIYGSTTASENTVQANRCLDEGTTMKYGVFEAEGNFNYILDNAVVNAPGLIRQNQISAATSRVSDVYPEVFLPVVASAGGTLGSYTSNATYQRQGKFVNFRINIAITNNGSGTGALIVTLPFTILAGALTGRDGGTGLQLVGTAESTNLMLVRTYSNGYPSITGSALTLSGVLELV